MRLCDTDEVTNHNYCSHNSQFTAAARFTQRPVGVLSCDLIKIGWAGWDRMGMGSSSPGGSHAPIPHNLQFTPFTQFTGWQERQQVVYPQSYCRVCCAGVRAHTVKRGQINSLPTHLSTVLPCRQTLQRNRTVKIY